MRNSLPLNWQNAFEFSLLRNLNKLEKDNSWRRERGWSQSWRNCDSVWMNSMTMESWIWCNNMYRTSAPYRNVWLMFRTRSASSTRSAVSSLSSTHMHLMDFFFFVHRIHVMKWKDILSWFQIENSLKI